MPDIKKKSAMQARIAIITSRFNEEITQRLHQGAIQRFQEAGNPIAENDVFNVPGAVEIPIVASILAKSGKYEAIVCLGAVIRGETSHYDYVCQQVSYGCQQTAVETHVPIIFGVLTTENEEQALARSGGGHSHKGFDCADAALEMVGLMRDLRSSINKEKRA